MTRTKTPPETHRIQISATVSPETFQALKTAQKPGEGLGQVIDRAIAALKGERNETT